MAKKLVLDMGAVEDDFFTDTAMIGISSALPGYKFSWLINKSFAINFCRKPGSDVIYKPKKTSEEQHYSVYEHRLPYSECKYILYRLKSEKESLLPELKNLDYLWLLWGHPVCDTAQEVIKILREIPEVQLAQSLSREQLKHINHLLL